MKTIYSKLMLLSLSVLLIGFIVLTVGLNMAYKSYIIEQNHLEMLNLAKDFNHLLDENQAEGTLSSKLLISELLRLEKYANLRVWMPLGKNLIYTDKSVIIDEAEFSTEDFNKVISTGEPVFRTADYAEFPGDQFYSLIYPITIDGKIVTAVYLNKAMPSINKTVNEINKFALITLILASLYAGVTMFVATKSVSDDIRKLNNGVKFVAKGNFDYEFQTNREDEIGELSRNFNLMIGELKGIEESRRKFISDLSHDLRSPITSIKGYIVGVLDGTIPPEKWEKYLNIAREESDRLTHLINEILDLSKMQTGELSVKKVDFDAHELLLNVLDKYEERLDKKHVEVTFKLASGNTMVEGDKDLIERVIYNLVDNAVKFVDEHGVLELMTNLKENKLLIGIRNTGTPIPQEKLAKIWPRFSKLDHSRGLNKGSSGLGLAIVKEILDAHGEKIDVYSNEYLGVMFVFSLNRSAFRKCKNNSE